LFYYLKGELSIKSKKLIYLIMLFIGIFIVFKGCSHLRAYWIHEHISISDVQSIVIRGRNTRNAAPEEAEKIVKWFNSIYDIEKNDFSGTTDISSIQIILKSNEKIGIFYPGKRNKDFEIQRYSRTGTWISYWGNQPDIKNILQIAASIK